MHVQENSKNFQITDSYSGTFLCTDEEATGNKSSPNMWNPVGFVEPSNSPNSIQHPCNDPSTILSPVQNNDDLDQSGSMFLKHNSLSQINASDSTEIFNSEENPISNTPAMHSHFIQNSTPTCEGCNELITNYPRYIIDDKLWHEECISCTVCKDALSDFCYLRRGKLYCKTDYLKLRMSCDGCGLPVKEKESIVPSQNKATHYVHHLNCCMCIGCGRSITAEECRFYQNDRDLVVLQCSDCWKTEENKTKIDGKSCHTFLSESPALSSDEAEFSNKSPSFLASPKSIYDDDNTLSSEEDILREVNSCKSDKESKKSIDLDSKDKKGSKRPRTILNGTQRSIFKNVFETTQKPTKKQREELARSTGLTSRVVQVWFQNQRAKIKKLSKRKQAHDVAMLHPPEMMGFHGFDPNVNIKMSPHSAATDFMTLPQYEELRRIHNPHSLLPEASYQSNQQEKWNHRRSDLSQFIQLPYRCPIQDLSSSNEVFFAERYIASSSSSMTQDLRNPNESLQSTYSHGGNTDYAESIFKATKRDSVHDTNQDGMTAQQGMIHSGLEIESNGNDACLMQSVFFSDLS